jgi:hypothetical protein
MLQITERINTSFKARLRNSRRRAVGNVTGKDEDDVEVSLLKASQYFQVTRYGVEYRGGGTHTVYSRGSTTTTVFQPVLPPIL